jgi:hypothetical protein
MFIAALFSIAKLLNQAKCSITNEWIKKNDHIYVIEYYSAIKKNGILSFDGKWMELEIIILRYAKLKKPNVACCMFSLICGN